MTKAKPEFRFVCQRCRYGWNPKVRDADPNYRPRQCPNCKQPRWDTPAGRPQGKLREVK